MKRHYDEMALFMQFYPGMTPQTFWDLDLLEYRALADHMERVQEANSEALSRSRSGNRGLSRRRR